jgi:hypothetical protein
MRLRTRWHKRVQTFDGSIALTLTLPHLLEAEAGHGSIASQQDSVPFGRPTHFALGSADEAAYVADELGPAYSMTAGATSWLRSQARKRRK